MNRKTLTAQPNHNLADVPHHGVGDETASGPLVCSVQVPAWVSTSLLKFLSSFWVTWRRSWSWCTCSGFLWLHVWTAAQGSQGGLIWRYLGLQVRIRLAAAWKPLRVDKSYPLRTPLLIALPPNSRTVCVRGASHGAHTLLTNPKFQHR